MLGKAKDVLYTRERDIDRECLGTYTSKGGQVCAVK
jgi:hypothetical protein